MKRSKPIEECFSASFFHSIVYFFFLILRLYSSCRLLKTKTKNTNLKISPKSKRLKDHIESFWVVNQLLCGNNSNAPMVSYPGITPEIVIPLSGYLEFQYLNKKFLTPKSVLFGFIHGNVYSYFKSSPRFVLITFKSRALASLMPFTPINSISIIKNSVVEASLVLGNSIDKLQQSLINKTDEEIVEGIENWLLDIIEKSREGFVTDILKDLSDDFSVQSIMQQTNYSYSTVERKLKSETGITPKQLLTLKRFKSVLAEMIETQNTDWMDYVVKFGYYDQSHLINEIKKYTGITPSKLILQDNLLSKRPDISFLTNFYNGKVK
ncbi:MAG: AraC family transcriptional regulator [Bacteroidota bacterium]